MNQWIDKDLFGKFQEKKKEEKSKEKNYNSTRRSDMVWDTPDKGTETQEKTYQGRFLADPNGEFYKRYFYHMFRSGEKWIFIICPKTDDFENYCPFCSVTAKLYNGTAADKKMAYNYKRKEKFVGNFYIVKDPRDEERADEDKVVGKVKLYEFPTKVEAKLKNEITDQENGIGASIFDPSDAGFDFILKVLSTKPTADGDTWPDYSNSVFARNAKALGTVEEITKIMKTTVDINKYINSMKRSSDEFEKILKDEHLFDFVEKEWNDIKSKTKAEVDLPDDIDDEALYKKHLENQKAKHATDVKEEDSKEDDAGPPWNEDKDSSGQSDADLLSELENM